MGSQVIARDRELKVLERLYNSGKAEFLAVYGRRRVGKTFLIREFFKGKGLYFSLTGVKGAKLGKQLKNFTTEFERVFTSFEKEKSPKDWQEAFTYLRKALEKVKGYERIILFFDELPWLASARSEFLQDLDHFWNRYLSEDPRIILIVCGSAASWMIRKIIKNKGGLYGRLTAEIRLLPFDLKETEEFLRHQGIILDRKALIDIYMAIGGIPKYLSYIQKGQSALQIISQLCFDGPLVDEFHELYSSLFDHHERHISIVKALAEHPQGLTKSQIAKATGLSVGGGLNMVLEELEQSGFIFFLRDFGKQKKEIRIRLGDEYSLFYLKWWPKAKENNLRIRDDKFWMSVFNTAPGLIWAGYAFEIVCFKHLPNIKKALGIAGVLTSASGWVYRPPKGNREKGVQIDLLIDRADSCINLCEIKYSNQEFVITKAIDQNLREKKNIFITQTQSK
ncbi:MAG TPA: ATP-binding protein, partial [Candidatus Babeliaceae bacterium]|nr:ATP-binding protein [Candidatus Babeliaceae bacterium]